MVPPVLIMRKIFSELKSLERKYVFTYLGFGGVSMIGARKVTTFAAGTRRISDVDRRRNFI
jgi:hypothetical protein